MRGRFAPSPTGELHLGSMSTALLAWLQVRQASGTLVLRVEDLDHYRVVPGMVDAQLRALLALGLDWDEGPGEGGDFEPYVQSERIDRYQAALTRLEQAGRVYRCYCSRAELLAQEGEGDGAPYPGTCRDLSPEACAAREAAGRPPAWRFRVRPGVVRFEDQVCGPIAQDVEREVGDFVVKRRDGVFAYQLAVVVDDLSMEIDHVLRGADLLDSTARQIQLYEALGGTVPSFAHVPIWLGPDGQKLGKRHGSVGVQTRLAAGETPAAILSEIAAALGLRAPVDSPRALCDGFRVETLGTKPVRWSPAGST